MARGRVLSCLSSPSGELAPGDSATPPSDPPDAAGASAEGADPSEDSGSLVDSFGSAGAFLDRLDPPSDSTLARFPRFFWA